MLRENKSNRSLTICQDHLSLSRSDCDYHVKLDFDKGISLVKKNEGTTTNEPPNQQNLKIIQIEAVYGVMRLEVNNYLVAVTKAREVGQILSRKIYQIEEVHFYCLAKIEARQDLIYVDGLTQLFQNKFWYFSYDYDLTNSFQSLYLANYQSKKRDQYFFNSHWTTNLKGIGADWVTPFISGYVSIEKTRMKQFECTLILITRRDKRRQGKRWLVRGCDSDGNTANTAETENILTCSRQGKTHLFSYVQMRGSIPFFWQQPPNMKWRPKVSIHPNHHLNSTIMKNHYDDILKTHESCTSISLINNKASQKKLGDYYEKIHQTIENPKIRLVWFDFNGECKNHNFENLAKLLDLIQHDRQNYGYFQVMQSDLNSMQVSLSSYVYPHLQKGIFRSNCMDCLDRTNIVQSTLSRMVLLQWFTYMDFIKRQGFSSVFEKLPEEFESIFKKQWIENGDSISLLYSGTPAMSADFTSTGKRTRLGLLNDGLLGIKRYIFGNFFDSKEQDFIDLNLGKIHPREVKQHRIRPSSVNSIYIIVLLTILFFCLAMHTIGRFFKGNFLKFPIKIIGSIFATGIFMLVLPKLKKIVVRKPIRSKSLLLPEH